jgi:replication factor C subunit 3/5
MNMDKIENNGVPMVEKHRPTNFEDIVLNALNKKILLNIIETSYFPNLLFYGPPGTGKTTTIINLINAYQTKINGRNKDLIIHLNASDERGIDIIRNQINCFVNSNPLFNNGMKFVILDEVDYMTKNAQQALRYLLLNFSCNVRFCLICNYISKIDEGLQNEFMKLRFNQLPKDDIIHFLTKISTAEKLNISIKTLSSIQKLYKSDIRSMINFIQSNMDIINYDISNNTNIVINDNYIISKDIWEQLVHKVINKETIESIHSFIYFISIKYNIDKKNIIKDFLNYIIRNHTRYVNTEFLNFVENLMHSKTDNHTIYINYSITKILHFITK